MPKGRAGRTALYGVLTALAMLLSYLETLIPLSVGIPGVKPGLANLASLTALYLMGPREAFFVSLARIVLTGLTFGNTFSLLYSLTGGMLSLAAMTFCKKRGWFGRMGVSMVGGVTHNIGQLFAAALVLESAAVFAYLPVLLLAGTAAGALIGALGALLLQRLDVRGAWRGTDFDESE